MRYDVLVVSDLVVGMFWVAKTLFPEFLNFLSQKRRRRWLKVELRCFCIFLGRYLGCWVIFKKLFWLRSCWLDIVPTCGARLWNKVTPFVMYIKPSEPLSADCLSWCSYKTKERLKAQAKLVATSFQLKGWGWCRDYLLTYMFIHTIGLRIQVTYYWLICFILRHLTFSPFGSYRSSKGGRKG